MTATQHRKPRLNTTCDLVVFDLDGTILDSHEVMDRAFNAAFRRARPGCDRVPFDELRKRQGTPFPEICRALDWPVDLIAFFIEESRRLLNDIEFFPQALDLIEFLFDARVPMAVLTGKDRLRSLELLAHLGLDRFFPLAVCGDDPYPGKPHPDGLLHLINANKCRPEATYYVGDAMNDLLCARAAGARFIGVEWPGQPSLLPRDEDQKIFQTTESIVRIFEVD